MFFLELEKYFELIRNIPKKSINVCGIIVQVKGMKYNCGLCNFSSNASHNFNTHLNTQKHIKMSSGTATNKLYCPHCLKGYNAISALYYHKRKCQRQHVNEATHANSDIAITNTLTNIQTIVADIKNKTSDNTTVNNTLTVNMFLSENVKLEFSFADMIKQIAIDRKFCSAIYFDMNYAAKVGEQIQKQFERLPVSKRPIHCVEGENESQKVLQVHDENNWHAETEKDIYCGIVSASVASLEREFKGTGLGKILHDMDRDYIRQITAIYENDSKELKEKVIKRFKASTRSMKEKFTLAQMIMEMTRIERTQLKELSEYQSDEIEAGDETI